MVNQPLQLPALSSLLIAISLLPSILKRDGKQDTVHTEPPAWPTFLSLRWDGATRLAHRHLQGESYSQQLYGSLSEWHTLAVQSSPVPDGRPRPIPDLEVNSAVFLLQLYSSGSSLL